MAELEEILQNLLVPDNTVIQQVNDKCYCTSITCFNISGKEHRCDLDLCTQATAQLREAFKDPAIVPALVTVLGSSQNPQVRLTVVVSHPCLQIELF